MSAVLQDDFADDALVACFSLRELACLEATGRAPRLVVQHGLAWARCAVESLRPYYEPLGLPWPRCESRASVRAMVTTLQSGRPVQAAIALRGLSQAQALARAISCVRLRAAKYPKPGGRLPHAAGCTFQFVPEAADAVKEPGSRMCVSAPVLIESPAADSGHEAWFLQMAWRHGAMMMRAVPVAALEGGPQQAVTASGAEVPVPVPPLLDIQSVSSSVVVRAHAVQLAAKGAWTKVAGLSYLAHPPARVANELREGLLCVVCMRYPSSTPARAHHVHVLTLHPAAPAVTAGRDADRR